jgi:hypothetical protein
VRVGLSLMAARWRAVRPSGSRVCGSTPAARRWATTCSFSCQVATSNIGPSSLPTRARPIQCTLYSLENIRPERTYILYITVYSHGGGGGGDGHSDTITKERTHFFLRKSRPRLNLKSSCPIISLYP